MAATASRTPAPTPQVETRTPSPASRQRGPAPPHRLSISGPPAIQLSRVEASGSPQQELAAAGGPIVAVQRSIGVQTALKIPAPSDPTEVEATATAGKIMRMEMPATAVAGVRTGNGVVFRQVSGAQAQADHAASPTATVVQRTGAAGLAQRQAGGTARSTPSMTPRIQAGPGGGAPLPLGVRRFMEPRFGADFSGVRIHTGEQAAGLSTQLSARAFTVGNDVFFGRGQFNPDSRDGNELIAHELTHTVQQGANIQRSEGTRITQQAPVQVQRLGIGDALNYFARVANNIPGFAMLTFVIGFNPINMRAVDRNATNLFRAIIGFLPGGEQIFQALQRHGIIDRVGAWAQQQFSSLGMAASSLRQALDRFLETLGWRDIFDLGGVWERARRIFTEPIDRISRFVRGLAGDILRFIRDAILRPVARLAEGTRGYDLLRLILGQDPITGDPYPRSAENMIGGFMRLIGQEEKWRHLQESRAIPRAWAWFQQQMGTLLGFVREIPQLFVRLWQALQIGDLLDIGGAFGKVRDIFGGFVGNFITWAGNAALQLMMFIFEALAPGAMPVLRRAAAVIRTIIGDPIRFVGNLVRAGLQGFRQFSSNIRTHLINGLVGWLTGALTGAGLQLPQRWDLRGILSLVLQILGLTWQNIRQKLLRHIPEPVLRGLETTFDIVVTLVRDGPAAAWQKILEQLQNLQEMVFGQIREWVARTVVGQAVTRILSMLNPAGAVIQAIIAIYNTIMFFRERLQQIIQVAEAFFNSIAQIAAGNIGAAADRVEQTMARFVPVAISFLARLIGLGGISDTIRNIIARIRAPIDRGLDRVVDWIVAQASSLLRRATGGTPDERLSRALSAAQEVVNRFAGRRVAIVVLRPLLAVIRMRYLLQSLEVVPDNGYWTVEGVANPRRRNPRSNTRTEEGGRKWQLAPGSYEEHENQVHADRDIHVLTKHVNITEAQLQDRMQQVIRDFRAERARRLQQITTEIHALRRNWGQLERGAYPAGSTPADVERRAVQFGIIQDRLDESQRRLKEVQDIRETDIDAVYRAMEGWKMKPPPRATRFHKASVMENSVRQALETNRGRLDALFTDAQGRPQPVGYVGPAIRDRLEQGIGIGYELNAEGAVVRIARPLKTVVVYLIVTNSENLLYRVQTAYPEP